MDMSKLKPNERTIEILNPDGISGPIGLRVTIMSISDTRMKKIRRQIQDKKTQREARGKTFKAEEIDENQNELIFSASLGWEWYNPTGAPGDEKYDAKEMGSYNGKQLEYTKDNFMFLLTEHEWFVDQMAEGITAEKDFFENSKAI